MRPHTALVLPELREFLAQHDKALVREAVEELHPADVADIAEHLSSDEAVELFKLLDIRTAIEAFERVPPRLQVRLVEIMGRERIVRVLDGMSPDDRADLLRELPGETRDLLLPLLAQAERNDVRRLLEYPEGTAGALLTTEYVALPGALTVEEALARIREVAPDRETIYYVYVTDPDRTLRGVCSLRGIVTAQRGRRLAELMTEQPVRIRVGEDQERVVEEFRKYDLGVLPVVDERDRLVGIITVDDVLDVAEEEATEDMHQAGAVGKVDLPYFEAGFWYLARSRGTWLVLLFLGGLVTIHVIEHFQGSLRTVAALTAFIPLIISSGGNSGSQSATLVIRGLAVGDVKSSDFVRVLGRETAMGIVLGGLLGTAGLARVAFFGDRMGIAGVVGISLVLVVVVGTVVGGLIPLVLDRLGLDPAVSSNPFIASLADVLGLLTYFTVAATLLPEI